MDEPLSHLDARLRNEMRTEIKAMREPFGTTIVYVTHDYSEALALGDRIASCIKAASSRWEPLPGVSSAFELPGGRIPGDCP